MNPFTVQEPDPLADEEGELFPVVIECSSPDASIESMETWIAEQADALDTRAAQSGVILFRGFPLRTDTDFDRFVAAFGWPNFTYAESLSNAVRKNRTERVFTANEAPSTATIFLHHEMAQTPVSPSKLFFFCEEPAERGGATSVCRSDWLLDDLTEQHPEFVKACAEKGLRYSHVMPDGDDAESGMGRSWQSTLSVDSRDAAEARLAGLGYTWEWETEDGLRVTTPVLPAIKALEEDRASFYNQILAVSRGWKDARNDPSKSLRHGDDTPLDPKAVAAALELAEALTVDLHWQLGDVALVDNHVAMHGRQPFEGSRKVLAALVR